MAWLDDRLRDHPKIIRASAPAFRHWALALCYCSAHGTGGRLDEAIKALGVPAKIVAELVDLKLWDRENDGLWVHDWQEHNAKRDADLDTRREAARERQRRHRAKLRGEVTRDDPVTSQPGHASLSRVTDPRAGARPRHARDHDQEVTPTAAANGVTPPAHAAAAEHLRERLKAIGLHELPNASNQLVTAWLNLADQEAHENPAGFVLAGIRTGQPPSPRRSGRTPKKRARATLRITRRKRSSCSSGRMIGSRWRTGWRG
jgi:hypothetical protein